MLKKTYELLYLFAKEPWKGFTFQEIKKLSKNKSESYVYNTLNDFVKEQILMRGKIGNVVVYKVNQNSKAISCLAFTAEYEARTKKHIPYTDFEAMMFKIPTNFFTLLVTGSYAKNKQTSKSDMDVVVITNIETKKVYAELRHFCEINIPSIHLYVFTDTEFLQMLLDKKPNYGKEIIKNNLVVFGGEVFYKILFKAIENGFSG